MARQSVHVVNGTLGTVTTVAAVTDITNNVEVNPWNIAHGVTYTNYTKDVETTNTTIRGAIAGRVACDIYNRDTATSVHIRLDGGGKNTDLSIEIAAGKMYRCPSPCTTQAITGYSDAGTVKVAIVEGVVS